MTLIEQMTQMINRIEDDTLHFDSLLNSYRDSKYASTPDGLLQKLDALEEILIEGASIQSQLYISKYFILSKVMKEMPSSSASKLKVKLVQLDELRDGLRSSLFPLVEAARGVRERLIESNEELKKETLSDPSDG